MTTQALTRSQRGMQIAMRTQKSWAASVVGLRIPSQTVAGRTYTTTPDACDCPDSIYRGYLGIACKHQIALRIRLGRNAS